MNIESLCAEVTAIYNKESDHKLQTEKLRLLLANVFVNAELKKDVDNLAKFVQKLVETVVNNESTSMVVSRQFISDIADQHLGKMANDTGATIKICSAILNQLQNRAIAYEEQSTQIRMLLANAYERNRDFAQAARTLNQIPLETSQRGYRAEFKMDLYLRITELFLDADCVEDAERNVKRASLLQQDVKESPALLLKYKALYARVLDRQGSFIEAAQRYYELSIKQGLLPSEKRQVLQNALTCTLLAPPGLQRNRLLNTLFKDERCQQGLIGYSLLKNMYLERLIQQSELTEFEASLSAHQRLLDAEGASILQRSVLEHNVLAASRLYANISFPGLGQLLGIPTAKAEKIASQMLSNDKVHGSINQLDGTVSFDVMDAGTQADFQMASICELTNSINERLAVRFPEWHAERMRANNAPRL